MADSVTMRPMPAVDQSKGLRLRRLKGGGDGVDGTGGVASSVTKSPPQCRRAAGKRGDGREVAGRQQRGRLNQGAAGGDDVRRRQILGRDLLVPPAGGKEFQLRERARDLPQELDAPAAAGGKEFYHPESERGQRHGF